MARAAGEAEPRAGPLPLPTGPPRSAPRSPRRLLPAASPARAPRPTRSGDERRCASAARGSRAEAAAAGVCPPRPGSGTGAGAGEDKDEEQRRRRRRCFLLPDLPSGASPCAPRSAAPPGRGAVEDGAGGPGPPWHPAAGGPGAVEGPAGGRRGRLLPVGRDQLAAVLRLSLPGPLRAGVPVQAVRQDRLLLLGPLCQRHLPLRPGLGGGPVPALPGQVQVNRTFWIFNRWSN